LTPKKLRKFLHNKFKFKRVTTRHLTHHPFIHSNVCLISKYLPELRVSCSQFFSGKHPFSVLLVSGV
jgi:hypothetical protein